MAIYHLEAKVVSRGAGRSAVAASAYLSCSRLYNDYDGIQHDYTKKQGLLWQQVFLPEYALQEWQDREKLWNAVEEVETAKDSRLAREFVVALPIELSREQQIELLQDFIREQFVADGMCADAAIHDTDGHNPHAHILLTVRPLDEQGKWQYKTEKEYLCMKNGEERGFTAAEFRTAQADGWEKQYPYKVGKKKVYMTPSAAEAQGLVRADKHPKSTRYGRQNPISERWNSEEQLVVWRAAWADVTNRYLERYGHDERIDHRSNAARGLDEIPTIHEGVTAQALERKGIISDRCEINRQIKADNALLRELKAAVKKLGQAVKNTIPVIAEAMEKVGSDGVTGMNSMYAYHFLQQLCAATGVDSIAAFQASKCLSADVTAAYDPSFSEAFEPDNGTYAGRGVAIYKYTGAGGKSSTSDANAELVSYLTRLMNKNGVVWQIGEMGRLDLGGGGTIAKYVANRDIDTIDIGVPVLAMHSPFEVVSKADVYMAYRTFRAFCAGAE